MGSLVKHSYSQVVIATFRTSTCSHVLQIYSHNLDTNSDKKLLPSVIFPFMASCVILAAVSCQVTSLALIALSSFTTYWLLRNPDLSNTSVLKGDNYGLWVYCTTTQKVNPPCQYISGFPEWWNASRSFIVMSSIVSLMALIAYFTTAFDFFPGERGRTTFIGATASLAECVFLVISLSIFHAKSITTYEAFHVGWSYYTAWIAFSFNMGSLIFVFVYFFCRPEKENELLAHQKLIPTTAHSNHSHSQNKNDVRFLQSHESYSDTGLTKVDFANHYHLLPSSTNENVAYPSVVGSSGNTNVSSVNIQNTEQIKMTPAQFTSTSTINNTSGSSSVNSHIHSSYLNYQMGLLQTTTLSV